MKILGLKYITTLTLSTAFVLSGCKHNTAKPDDPAFAPVPPQAMIAPANDNGSLYREGYGLSLFEDTTAKRVGDILTVKLVENFSSETSSETDIEKESTVDVTNPTLFGSRPKFNLPGIIPLATTGSLGNTLGFDIDSTTEFTGDGSSKQSGKLSTGTISVNVVEVLPNGNLKVRGEKWLYLNNDEQYVRLSGIVRPDDINETNEVDSTKIANARIAYSGTGTVSESSVPGWLAKFFVSALWPL